MDENPQSSQKTTDEGQEQRSQIIRAELNIERWPSIWLPSKAMSRALDSQIIRVLEKADVLDNGDTLSAKVRISADQEYGPLNTEDQKVFYALIYLWENQGKPKEFTFSIVQLATLLKKDWGEFTREAIKKSLKKLRLTNFSWENSYYDKSQRKTLKNLEFLTLLSNLKISEVQTDGRTNKQSCKASFFPEIEKNLKENYSRPTRFKLIIGFRSGISQLIYKYLELKLYKNILHERKSKDLFDELGLLSNDYKKLSHRKRTLDSALKELQNIPIQDGVLSVQIETTVDKKDVKIVASKKLIEIEDSTLFKDQDGVDLNLNDQSVPDTFSSEMISPSTITPSALVGYFHEIFNVKRKKVNKKELEHAHKLIETYSLSKEKGQFIVEFACEEARKTNFSIQQFGGILQYVDVALTEYEKQFQNETQGKMIAEAVLEVPEEEKEPYSSEAAIEKLLSLNEDGQNYWCQRISAVIDSEKLKVILRYKPEVARETLLHIASRRFTKEILEID